MTSIETRWLSPAEVVPESSRLLEISCSAKASWGYAPDFMAQFRDLMRVGLATPGLTIVVAHEGAHVLGFAGLRARPDVAWLDDLWVEPQFHGRGYGRTLFAAACEWAREGGFARLECDADPHAEDFYAHLGMTRYAERRSDLDAGRTLPLMRIELV